MKRVDLILSEPELASVLEAIDKAGCAGYTVTRHVTGRGPHGRVSEAMDFSGSGANAHAIVFCEINELEALRSEVLPLLRYYGGVGYASDAEHLRKARKKHVVHSDSGNPHTKAEKHLQSFVTH